MRIVLGTHTYAPELNTAYIAPPHAKTMGECIQRPVPGVTTIREARRTLFAPATPAIIATVSKTYPEEFAHLNRTRRGIVPHRADAVAFAHGWRAKEQGGPLLDGRTLPAPIITVRTELRNV
jgi:hypothetical protein